MEPSVTPDKAAPATSPRSAASGAFGDGERLTEHGGRRVQHFTAPGGRA